MELYELLIWYLFLPPPRQPNISLACPTAQTGGRFRPDEEDGVVEIDGN